MAKKPPRTIFEDLRSAEALPETVTLNSRAYVVQARAGLGNQGVVWKVRDEFGRDLALKLLHPDHYTDRPFLQEISRASLLGPYKEFATFFDAGTVHVQAPKSAEPVEIQGFLEEWVPGVPLDQFLDRQPEYVSVSFFLGYVRFMCGALSALNAVKLIHDDLYPRNVMICSPLPGSLYGEATMKIVDTGSLKPGDHQTKKTYDDHQNFVVHLVSIWNVVHKTIPASARDRRFLRMVVPILRSMLDQDFEVALRDPKHILDTLLAADSRANTVDQNSLTLTSPFEFISAEHIANDDLLVKLFAETCPWLQKVSGPDPCLVTGPRGCGKSTMFRWLSLKAHLSGSFAAISKLRLSGFYVSCSTDLQNRLSWIRTPVLADRLQKEIVHYFNLVIAREVATTLFLISHRDDRRSAWSLGETEERYIYQFFRAHLPERSLQYMHGVSRFGQVREAIEREMAYTHSRMLQGGHIDNGLSESFLGDLTELLTRHIPFFSQKRIAILLDDFSIHRLPEPIQLILNRVIWERRPTHVFKLSSEKYGAKLTDSQGASIDITREMVEIDCGREHVSLEDNELNKAAVRFAEELLDNRLKAAGYSGRVKTLIGVSKWRERSLDWALANKAPGRHEGDYHGIQTIAKLCSGDVSALLYVYRRIFELGNVSATSARTIDQITQDRAIREVSRRFLDATKHSVPYGKEMFQIANAFGRLVRTVLTHGKPQQKGKSMTRSQIPRIEIDQPKGHVVDLLNPTQSGIAQELIRRAVFIEMDPGLSRHGNVTTLRWHFRRIYLPSFGAALAKNNAVKKDVEWLRYFLTDPDGACSMVWKTWPRETNMPDVAPPAASRFVMAQLRQIELSEVIGAVPPIVPLESDQLHGDVFICALGFETRCLEIPRQCGQGGVRFEHAVVIEYEVNEADNATHRGPLLGHLASSARRVTSILSANLQPLQEILSLGREKGSILRVVFDISVASNTLLLRAFAGLWNADIDLVLVYSEAAAYRPLREEYVSGRKRWLDSVRGGTEHGVDVVGVLPDHPGNHLDPLPDCALIFPNFKPDRSKAALNFIDPSLLAKPNAKVKWFIGIPHAPEDEWREEAMRKLNGLDKKDSLFPVSTFDYRNTLSVLESVFVPLSDSYNVTLVALGSKLQAVASSIFLRLHPEVRVVYAAPRDYSSDFSRGCRATWMIVFNSVRDFTGRLANVGQLRME